MFRSLLHQLCTEPSVLSYITSIFAGRTETRGKIHGKWDWHVEELKGFFTKCLLEIALEKEVMLFVDALDEAGADQPRDLAAYFKALSCNLLAKNTAARICISCRHYPVIAAKTSLDIYVEQENHIDIEAYVRNGLGKISWELSEDRDVLSQDISRRAVGIFQWGKSSFIDTQ
jgi:hypothetical protein